MLNCKLCNQSCKSWGSLSKHIRDQHPEYTSKSYYDKFLLTSSGCKICNALTKFENIQVGYKNTCSHKCGGIYHRKKLAADPVKHEKFANTVSVNQTKIWKDRKASGDDIVIAETIRKTIKTQYALMSDKEKQEKCGWLNKLSKEEKEYWIAEVMTNTGAHKWWKTATINEKQPVIDRRNASKLGITIDEYLSRYDNLDDYDKYRWYVWILTERTYKENKHTIDPHNMRGPEYHLDHKFSVVRGYHLQIDPKIIASVHNLEILPASDNSRKGGKCSINIETLMEMCNG